MNLDRLHGIWKQWSGKMREQWGMLTGDPLVVAAGTCERLAGKIQEHRGLSQQEADQRVEDFMSHDRNWWDLSRR